MWVTCLFTFEDQISDQHLTRWWRHNMETLSTLLALCGGIHRSRWIPPHKGPVMRGFDISLGVSLNKLPNKQSRGGWIDMSWRSFDVPVMHDDVKKWKHFPRYWPFVRGIHRSPVNSPHKGQWRRALMFSLICVWISDWVNNREAGGLRRYCAHHNVIVMKLRIIATLDQPPYIWLAKFGYSYTKIFPEYIQWKPRDVITPTLSSLLAPDVVIMVNSCAPSDDEVGICRLLVFQCLSPDNSL